MKIIGQSKVGEGYGATDALVCIVTIDELKKVANKAKYCDRDKFAAPAIGSDYPIAEGHDFRAELTSAIQAMQVAYEKFAKVAPIAARFAGLVLEPEPSA